MEITKYYNYFEDTNLQAIELKFIKESTSAIIILPNEKIDINGFIDILDKDNEYFYTIVNNMKYSSKKIKIIN